MLNPIEIGNPSHTTVIMIPKNKKALTFTALTGFQKPVRACRNYRKAYIKKLG